MIRLDPKGKVCAVMVKKKLEHKMAKRKSETRIQLIQCVHVHVVPYFGWKWFFIRICWAKTGQILLSEKQLKFDSIISCERKVT